MSHPWDYILLGACGFGLGLAFHTLTEIAKEFGGHIGRRMGGG